MILIGALASPSAQAQSPTPGKLGWVNVAFSIQESQPGFKDKQGNLFYGKTLVDTPTAYRRQNLEIIKTSRYGNRELIGDLLNRFALPDTHVASYRLEAVRANDPSGFSGLFLTHIKSGAIIFLGTIDSPAPGHVFSGTYQGLAVTSSSGTLTEVRDAWIPVTRLTEGKSGYRALVSVEIQPLASLPMKLWGLRQFGVAYRFTETSPHAEDGISTLTYTQQATLYSGLVGEGKDSESNNHFVVSGSIRVSALKEVPDITQYLTAYEAAMLEP